MNLEEIKKAVDDGITVFYKSKSYVIIKGASGYLIKCTFNDYCIGLTHADGITMNGSDSDFYIEEAPTTYSAPISQSPPKNLQEGLQNFVQYIINKIESGDYREALLTAVDLRQDIMSKIYECK